MSMIEQIVRNSKSESFKRINSHLLAPPSKAAFEADGFPELMPKPKERIKQSKKPLLNKLETEYYNILCSRHSRNEIHAQAWRVKIANGAWFKVDFCGSIGGRWTAWEVKGNKGKNIDRGKLALKVAAGLWPEVRWFIAWKQHGQWHEQEILP